MQIKKAVITAAARGERLYPVADTVQKAMLPIIDIDGINKPIIQIIAEEALMSGIEEICVICAPGDAERYIESFQVLQSTLLKAYKNSDWAQQQAANIKNLLDRISFVIQKEPLGFGHAVYQAKQFANDEPILLLSGDYLYVSNIKGRHCAQQLIELAIKEDCSVSAVNPTLEHLIGKYGTLTGKTMLNYKGVYEIEKIIEKPSVSLAELELQTPGLRSGYYLCFFGMHVFKPALFGLLEEYMKGMTENIQLTPVLQELSNRDKYLAFEMKGNRYDTSKHLGLFEAQIALGQAGVIKDQMLNSIIQIMADGGKGNL
jgi:UTP--glucose-1-phosphate uridylyltransferase